MNLKTPPDLFSQYISAFDKSEYHAKADNFPQSANYYQAYVHIGFFLGFLADEGLLSEKNLAKKKVKQFLGRQIKPGELCKSLGGKMDPFDFNSVGTQFTYFYYPGDSANGDIVGISSVIYLNEYAEVLSSEIRKAGSPYLISDSWENYDKVKEQIGERYRSWVASGSPAPHYRHFKGLSDSDAEKVKIYLSNILSADIGIEETTFKSYTIKIDGRGDREAGKKLYASEGKIREYLKNFTDRHLLFNLK